MGLYGGSGWGVGVWGCVWYSKTRGKEGDDIRGGKIRNSSLFLGSTLTVLIYLTVI